MCWIGYIKDKRVAEKDIHCKKIIAMRDDNTLSGWYMPQHSYTLGKTYQEDIRIIYPYLNSEKINIGRGLHCYSDVCKMVKYVTPYSCYDYLIARLKKRSDVVYKKDEFLFRNAKPLIVEVIIPKGTTYYENDLGEIVTEKFILTKTITPDILHHQGI